MAEMAVAAAGSKLGQMAAGDTGSGPSLDQQMNAILNKYLDKGLNYNSRYTNQAIGQQNNSLNSAMTLLQQYNTAAQKAASGTIQNALSQSASIRSPYIQQGNTAMDQYMRTLGLPVVAGGSSALTAAAQQAQKLAPILQSLNGNYQLGDAPTLDPTKITQQQIKDYIAQNTSLSQKVSNRGQKFNWATYNGAGSAPNTAMMLGGMNRKTPAGPDLLVNQLLGNQGTVGAVRNQLAQDALAQANQGYQAKQQTFNQLGTLLGSMDPTQQKLLATQLKGLL